MKAALGFFVLYVLSQAIHSWSAHDLREEYRFYAAADENGQYEIYWNFDLDTKIISFAVRVNTTGWVGFGLSPNGGMPGSDVVIGWVDHSGKVFFHDRYAEDRFLPPIDESQDWFLVSGEEEDGFTVLEFTRHFQSCDGKDLNVEWDTSRVVWSWSSEDPSDIDKIRQHEFQGSISLNLLGGLNEERRDPPDAASFIIRNENLILPDSDTTYWCSAFQLPPEIRKKERFIYKISPSISEESLPHVHHILVFLCQSLDEADIGSSSLCDTASVNVNFCRGQSMIGGWAVGGNDFVTPEGVAFPVGGPGNVEHVVMEMHYDNPKMVSGVQDSSGLEFFYTNEEPTHRAGILAIGHVVTNNMVIPPNAENFTVSGLCSGDCTQTFFPADGITAFANILHTHVAGHGLVLQHFRKNDECGALEELPPVDSNLKYDFNYQQFNVLPEGVKILPGDTLRLQCFYGTLNSTLTLGGESTRDEMCYSFLAYYPRVDLSLCISAPVVPNSYSTFANQHIDHTQHDFLYQSLIELNENGIREVLEAVEWTPEAIQSLQDSMMDNDVFQICLSDFEVEENNIFKETSYPSAQCPYESPDTCSLTGTEPLPCCDRVASTATRSVQAHVWVMYALYLALSASFLVI